jgi:hypothetical protein
VSCRRSNRETTGKDVNQLRSSLTIHTSLLLLLCHSTLISSPLRPTLPSGPSHLFEPKADAERDRDTYANVARSRKEAVSKLVNRARQYSIRRVEGFFHPITMMNVDVDVENSRVISVMEVRDGQRGFPLLERLGEVTKVVMRGRSKRGVPQQLQNPQHDVIHVAEP